VTDYDKKQWQAEQELRDKAIQKQREKNEKAKVRKARNAQRKLDRLRAKLKKTGDLTDWENEFSESVSERLDKYGSAFQDPEKGSRSEALSYAQKKVVSSLNKKAKGGTAEPGLKNKRGFKSKNPKFTPRVRNIEDDMPDLASGATEEVFIPKYEPSPKKLKPYLRIVKTGHE